MIREIKDDQPFQKKITKLGRNRAIRFCIGHLMCLGILTCVFHCQSINIGASPGINQSRQKNFVNEFEKIIPAFPTGALVTFAKPAGANLQSKPPLVYLKSYVTGLTWLAEKTQFVRPPITEFEGADLANSNSTEESFLGFVIPQVPRGKYQAWYANEDNTLIDSFEFEAIPYLLPRTAHLTGIPSTSVQAAIGIESTFVWEKGASKPYPVSVPISLTSLNPSVADISSKSATPAFTGTDGAATWSIEIKSVGTAEFVAQAVGYEPVTIVVTGSELPTIAAATYKDLQKARVNTLTNEIAFFKANEKLKEQQLRVDLNPTNESSVKDLASRIKAAEIQEQRFETTIQREIEVQASLKELVPAFKSGVSPQPGDVLLMDGRTPISAAIKLFEGIQLGGGVAPFSHAALYVGLIDGKHVVAEMLDNGYVLRSIQQSRNGTRSIRVFRWVGIDSAKQSEIAKIGRTYCGDPLELMASERTCVPYAFGQISVLMGAVTRTPFLNFYATGIAMSEGGPRKMICSEFVARVYKRAGLNPQANTWWPALEDAGVLTSTNRRLDYVTPNMLYRNSRFQDLGPLSDF